MATVSDRSCQSTVRVRWRVAVPAVSSRAIPAATLNTVCHMQARTHEVTNQAPPLVDYDLFSADQALCEAVRRYDGDGAVGGLAALGARAGSAQAQRWGLEANTHPPALRT